MSDGPGQQEMTQIAAGLRHLGTELYIALLDLAMLIDDEED